MPDHPVSPLLVMLKPGSAANTCSRDDVESITGGWADLLAWLNGRDLADLQHQDLIRAVTRNAALRVVRFPEYDIRIWMSQAPQLITPTAAVTIELLYRNSPQITNLIHIESVSEQEIDLIRKSLCVEP